MDRKRCKGNWLSWGETNEPVCRAEFECEGSRFQLQIIDGTVRLGLLRAHRFWSTCSQRMFHIPQNPLPETKTLEMEGFHLFFKQSYVLSIFLFQRFENEHRAVCCTSTCY